MPVALVLALIVVVSGLAVATRGDGAE